MFTTKLDKNFQMTCSFRGFTLTTDLRAELGGDNVGPEPPELVSVALANCVGTFFLMYCANHDLKTEGVEVVVTPEMVSTPRKRIAKITVDFKYPPDFPENKKRGAEAFCRACPVGATLEEGAEVIINFH